MKKKIYFIISSVLQIMGALYILFNVTAIIQSQLDAIAEVYSMLPMDFQERALHFLENGGPKILTIYSIIEIILNVYVIIIAVKDGILRNKGKLIAISIICFLTAESSIVSLLSIVNFIVLLCLKRKKPEDYPVKQEIPHFEYQKSTKKEIIWGIVLFIVYFAQMLLNDLLPDDVSDALLMAIVIGIYLLLLVLSIFFFKDRLKRDMKLLKDNVRAYAQFLFPKFGMMYVVFIAINLICLSITQQATSVNQATLESLPLWFVIPAAILWAPIVEECIFRGVLRRLIKHDKLFIATSAIIFGLLHSLAEVTILNVIVMAIPYAFLGGFLAYLYVKTENITVNMFAHAFHNTIAILLSLMASLIWLIK